MANAQVVLRLSKDFFKRNNPIDVIVSNAVHMLNEALTFNSKMKLLKYKFMLEQQKLKRLEQVVGTGSPYEIQGHKIDKDY